MTNELVFACAATITFGLSLLVSWYLRRHLVPVLSDYCGKSERGRLWGALCTVVIICLPLFALTLDLQRRPSVDSWFLAVAEQMRWAFFALVAATLFVGGVALAMHVPHELPFSRADLDDLQRLLVKVQELRALDLLRTLEEQRAREKQLETSIFVKEKPEEE